jgi:hypothetical protein
MKYRNEAFLSLSQVLRIREFQGLIIKDLSIQYNTPEEIRQPVISEKTGQFSVQNTLSESVIQIIGRQGSPAVEFFPFFPDPGKKTVGSGFQTGKIGPPVTVQKTEMLQNDGCFIAEGKKIPVNPVRHQTGNSQFIQDTENKGIEIISVGIHAVPGSPLFTVDIFRFTGQIRKGPPERIHVALFLTSGSEGQISRDDEFRAVIAAGCEKAADLLFPVSQIRKKRHGQYSDTAARFPEHLQSLESVRDGRGSRFKNPADLLVQCNYGHKKKKSVFTGLSGPDIQISLNQGRFRGNHNRKGMVQENFRCFSHDSGFPFHGLIDIRDTGTE